MREGAARTTFEELGGILPTEQIEPQLDGERSSGGSWAVEPAAEIELIELLKWANASHAAVFTRRPRRGDAEMCGMRPRIYLRGGRMRRVKDLDIVSGTITVQTGIAVADLHRYLAERSFTTGLPTRPWRQESVGAILAAALDAHWGPRYGNMVTAVLGIGVVFPDGSSANSRRSPRRAVGPDFDKLFMGSRGHFGIIHEATLRIYPTASRTVLSYAARDLASALDAVRGALEQGLDSRAVEVLTPTIDRSWGRKRVGLTDDKPVLVIVEPWGPLAGRPLSWIDTHFGEALTRLEPPVGWNVHEGLLPQPRAWRAPVVGVPWKALMIMAKALGPDVPPGLWLVRLSRHGGWLSVADETDAEAYSGAGDVRAVVAAHVVPDEGPWSTLQDRLKRELDPKGILNPRAQ